MNLNTLTPADGPSRAKKTWSAGIGSSLKELALSPRPAPAGYKAACGLTLPELMITMAVGFLVLAVMASVFLNSAFSFAAMGNYVCLDSHSRNALDHMTREIRQAGDLLEFSPTRVKFALLGETNSFLIYNWDAPSRQLTEWKSGAGTTNILLTECDQLAFSMRNSLFLPTTTVSDGKGIGVAWKCSRTLLGDETTSEDMAQALIIMRNKPL